MTALHGGAIGRLAVSAAAADAPQGSSFDLRQPQGLLDLVWRHPRGPPSASNLKQAVAAWPALLEQQYAQLQGVAGQMDSFSADSWELFGPDDVPLRLADFLALLPTERLASVALRLHPDEALPGAALCALRPYHRLRNLCIRQLEATDRGFGPQQSPELKQRDDAAAARLGALAQLRSLCIVRDTIPAAAMVACRQLTSLVLDDSRGPYCLQGVSGLTALQALSHLELHQPEYDFRDPLPAPDAFPALDSFWYSVSQCDDPHSLLLTDLADDATEDCFYPGVCSISFKDGTLRLEGIFDEMHPFQRIPEHVLPEGAHLRALELAAGYGFGELDDMDWTCSRLLSVTALAVDWCSIGRLPALLAQMPHLETLALTHCRGAILFTEEDDDYPFVDCTTVLAALPSLPRLTQLSLTAREDCTLARLDSFPPLPGLLHLTLPSPAVQQLLHMDPSPLAACSQLHTLKVTAATREPLRHMTRKQAAMQSPCQLTESDAATLVATLPGLKRLEIEEGVAPQAVCSAISAAAPGLQVQVVSVPHNEHRL